jgi:NAD(P)-dependent dehydrogenase (short-subunit alcohol dehydrogenase family)
MEVSGVAFYSGVICVRPTPWIEEAMKNLVRIMMFKGKVVAITGAAGGIGQNLCRYFAGEGASISAIDKSAALVDFAAELAEEGVAIRHAIVDVGDPDAVAKAFAAFETTDVLVNNAGFSEHPTFAKTDPGAWRHDINGNLNGAYYCAHAVIPGMKARGGGSIVAIGSVNGISGFGDPAYSAAKAGMISLTRRLPWNMGAMASGKHRVARHGAPLWEHKAGADTPPRLKAPQMVSP